MTSRRWMSEIGACAVLLFASFQVLAADPVDSRPPEGPAITVTTAEPSDPRRARTVVSGGCHKRLYSLTISGLGEGKGYVSLEMNHKAIRKYSDEPFVRDVLRQKQIIRLYLMCGAADRGGLLIRAFGISFENPEQPQYFEMGFGLTDSGEWLYPTRLMSVTYEHWLHNVGAALQK